MTTMSTLNDVRAALIARGYSEEQVDAMLDLAGRMVLEGSLASKDDLNQLRDEFALFKIDVAEQFAELRTEMNTKFAELRTEMNTKFAELRTEMNTKFAELRTEMNAKFAETDVKFAELRADMNTKFAEQRTEISAMFDGMRVENARSETRIIKWVFGAIFAGVVLNTGITSLLLIILPNLID